MDPELTKVAGVIIAVAVGAGIVLATILVIARRRLENGWIATQQQRGLLYDRLKHQGVLVQKFMETANYRLTGERDSLEVLGRRQTKVATGRTPPEKAAAMIPDNSWLVIGKVSGEIKKEIVRDSLDSNNIPSVILSSTFGDSYRDATAYP